jgi:hypothetical protein
MASSWQSLQLIHYYPDKCIIAVAFTIKPIKSIKSSQFSALSADRHIYTFLCILIWWQSHAFQCIAMVGCIIIYQLSVLLLSAAAAAAGGGGGSWCVSLST